MRKIVNCRSSLFTLCLGRARRPHTLRLSFSPDRKDFSRSAGASCRINNSGSWQSRPEGLKAGFDIHCLLIFAIIPHLAGLHRAVMRLYLRRSIMPQALRSFSTPFACKISQRSVDGSRKYRRSWLVERSTLCEEIDLQGHETIQTLFIAWLVVHATMWCVLRIFSWTA